MPDGCRMSLSVCERAGVCEGEWGVCLCICENVCASECVLCACVCDLAGTGTELFWNKFLGIGLTSGRELGDPGSRGGWGIFPK